MRKLELQGQKWIFKDPYVIQRVLVGCDMWA